MTDDGKPVSYAKRFDEYMERLKDCVSRMRELSVEGEVLWEEAKTLAVTSPAGTFVSFSRDTESLKRDVANLAFGVNVLDNMIRLLGK